MRGRLGRRGALSAPAGRIVLMLAQFEEGFASRSEPTAEEQPFAMQEGKGVEHGSPIGFPLLIELAELGFEFG